MLAVSFSLIRISPDPHLCTCIMVHVNGYYGNLQHQAPNSIFRTCDKLMLHLKMDSAVQYSDCYNGHLSY